MLAGQRLGRGARSELGPFSDCPDLTSCSSSSSESVKSRWRLECFSGCAVHTCRHHTARPALIPGGTTFPESVISTNHSDNSVSLGSNSAELLRLQRGAACPQGLPCPGRTSTRPGRGAVRTPEPRTSAQGQQRYVDTCFSDCFCLCSFFTSLLWLFLSVLLDFIVRCFVDRVFAGLLSWQEPSHWVSVSPVLRTFYV